MFAIRDSSGKVVRIAVGFPGVQFERVPWYENGKVILPVLACSLVILAAVLRLTCCGWAQDFSFQAARAPTAAWERAAYARVKVVRHSMDCSDHRKLECSCHVWRIDYATDSCPRQIFCNDEPGHRRGNPAQLLRCFCGIARLAALRHPVYFQVEILAGGGGLLLLTWFSVHWHLIGAAHRF